MDKINKKVNITKISMNDIFKYGKDRFNSNNHWDIEKPIDYDIIINSTNTCHWIDEFHKDYPTIIIYEKDLKWMWNAYEIGRSTGNFSKLYNDELEDMLNRYKKFDYLFTKKYFIRSENVSLKYGVHGTGPYTNFKDIIESICTTISGHKIFHENDKECKLYLLPWIENFDIEKEYRVFVYNKKITAISQQNLYKINNYLKKKTENELNIIVNEINDYYESYIKNKINLDHYVMDIYMNDKPYFIEVNSFGKKYASGSSLFHWIIDDKILHDSNEISLRICIN